jgi:hypothetical protein
VTVKCSTRSGHVDEDVPADGVADLKRALLRD